MATTQHKTVLVKSPLDLMGLFLVALRERFAYESVGPDFPWIWNEDSNLTKLFIEVGSGDETEQKDVRPAIYVERSPIIFPKIVLGDFVGEQRTTGLRAFYTTATGQILFECVSSNRGESAILGEITQSFVLMSSDLIQKQFTLRSLSPLTLGATEVWEKDKTLYNTRVTVEISYDVKWTNKPIAGKIAQGVVRIQTPDANVFHDLAISSLTR
jgi:hypothetical protein